MALTHWPAGFDGADKMLTVGTPYVFTPDTSLTECAYVVNGKDCVHPMNWPVNVPHPTLALTFI